MKIRILFLIVIILILNAIIRKSDRFKEEYLYIMQFRYPIQNGITLLSLGSTYAEYASQSFKTITDTAFNGAVYSEKVLYSYKILKKMQNHLKDGANVLMFISPILLALPQDYKGDTKYHNIVLNYNEMEKKDRRLMEKILYYVPILNYRLYRGLFSQKKLEYDELWKKQIGNIECQNEYFKSRAETWANQIGVENLLDVDSDGVIEDNVEKNLDILKKIRKECLELGYKLYFVVPPFGQKLNCYIGENFEHKILSHIYDSIKDVEVINFMRAKEFQDNGEYFCDEGFLLNQYGSKKLAFLLSERIELK